MQNLNFIIKPNQSIQLLPSLAVGKSVTSSLLANKHLELENARRETEREPRQRVDVEQEVETIRLNILSHVKRCFYGMFLCC
jgi:ABC-type transporter Mla subunit MlaD